VRSTASIALHVLRVLEDALIKSSSHDVVVRTRTPVALYILNQKRANLRDLEGRFGVVVAVEADDSLTAANYHAIERGEPATGVKIESEPPRAPAEDLMTIVEEPAPLEEDEEEILEAPGQEGEEASGSERGDALPAEDGEVGRHRRRRRRRRGGERPFGDNPPQDAPQPTDDGLAVVAEIGGDLQAPTGDADAFDRRGPRGEEERHRRSRRSRGGRNRFSPRSEDDGMDEAHEASETETSATSAPAEPLVEFEPHSGQMSLLPVEPVSSLETTPAPGVDAPQSNPEASIAAADAAQSSGATPEPAETAPSPQPPEEAAPAVEEPPRPRRKGWWQRARASVIGG
jgi:ribonuclease E